VAPVQNLNAIDEDGHVLAELTLIVEHVSSRSIVYAKVIIEHVAHGYARDLERGTRNVALNILREPYSWHRKVSCRPDLRRVSLAWLHLINAAGESATK
jgi:hypothetical protein